MKAHQSHFANAGAKCAIVTRSPVRLLPVSWLARPEGADARDGWMHRIRVAGMAR